mmetsp:Transcript_131107/g.327104  ORF Transcript_131107/g.327104 Transcript_131107/m.327104 type:complete len:495 (+) Transcript_131107:145-1629(+)
MAAFSTDEGKGEATTVSVIIERLGLTLHHRDTILFTWWLWIFCGWTATSLVFALDAAGEDGSDWVRITSPSDRLTMEDKSWTLLVTGILAAVGNQMLGFGSDAYGRISMSELCVLNGVIGTMGFALARSKFTLIVCICINPFIKDGTAMITQSMLGEWLPVYWRGIFLVSLHAMWNVGRAAITLVWAWVPPGEHWVFFFSISSVLPTLICLYMRVRGWRYESPRWLAVSGDVDSCITNLKFCAESGAWLGESEQLPRGWDDPKRVCVQADTGGAVQAQQQSLWARLTELLSTPHLRYVFLVLCVAHFALFYSTAALFFWAIEYFKESGLHDAVVPAMVAAPIGKILGNLSLIVGGPKVCLIDRCPRIPLIMLGYFSFGVCVLLLCASRSTIVLTAVMFFGHFFQEVIWAVGGVYVTEVFPTSVRNSAVGTIYTVGSMGNVLGNVISGPMMEAWVYLPMLVIATLLLLGGLCGSLLLSSERKHQTLSDTVGYGAC